MHAGLSVVIPNYNGRLLLQETLPTVFNALENQPLPFELIVADDASTDDSVSFLQSHFPSVIVIRNSNNSGFSITSNSGVNNSKYNIVLLLNSDVKLEKDYFKFAIPHLKDPDVFGVSGRIIGWNDEHIQDGAKFPSFHLAKIKTSLNYLLLDEREMEKGIYTMYLSGANILFDKVKFLQIGGFNEIFSPFYVEDFELSLRAWRLGWKCIYQHSAICRHRTSSTIPTKTKSNWIKGITARNKMFLHAIHLDGFALLGWYVQAVFELLFQTLTGKAYYFKAFLAFIKQRQEIRLSRAKLRTLKGKEQLLSVARVAKYIKNSIGSWPIKVFHSHQAEAP